MLVEHVQSVHEKKKEFSCAFCNETFAQKPNMERHQNEVHLHLKAIKCAICQKVFSRKDNLETHVKKVHEREKKYKCDLCDQTETSFERKKDLASHIKLVHKPKVEKILNCAICNESFEFECHRKQHQISCQKKFAILQNLNSN